MIPARPGPVQRSALATMAAVLVLSLAACSDDGEEPTGGAQAPSQSQTPQGQPSQSLPPQGATPSADPTESPRSPGAVPSEATATTPAGVKAYAEHWVRVLNHAVASGDSAGLRALSDGCTTCDALAGGVDALAEAGGHVTGEGWLLQEVAVQPGLPKKKAEAQLAVLRRPEAVEESAGADPSYFEGGEDTYRMRLRHDGETWLVTALDPVLS